MITRTKRVSGLLLFRLIECFDMYIIILKNCTHNIMLKFFHLYFHFVQMFTLEKQKIHKKGEIKATKTCSCIYLVKFCEGDLVTLSSDSLIFFRTSAPTYPISVSCCETLNECVYSLYFSI